MKQIILVFVVALYLPLYATHMLGGELTYRSLGGNMVEVTANVYVDCSDSIFPNLYKGYVFKVWDDSGIELISDSLRLTTKSRIIVQNSDTCIPSNFLDTNTFCYMKGSYIDTFLFPYLANSGYTMAINSCCYPSDLLNVNRVGLFGFILTASIKYSGYFVQNPKSSPVFTDLPEIYTTTNNERRIYNHAMDPDGDTIIYEYHHPHVGIGGSAYSKPSSSNSVNYSNGFSKHFPFGGTDTIQILDSGSFYANPTTMARYVYGVRVYWRRWGFICGHIDRVGVFTAVPGPCDTSTTKDTTEIPDLIGEYSIGSNSIIIYPNPAQDYLTLISKKEPFNQVILRDLSGRIVYSKSNLDVLEHKLSVQDLPPGVYLIEVTSQGQGVLRRKVVVE